MRALTLLSVSIWLNAAVAAAQPPGAPVAGPPSDAPVPSRLTLQEALARAMANSHRLAELGAVAEASEAAAEQRRAADNPVLALQAGYTRINHVDEVGFGQPDGTERVFWPDVPDNWRTRLDLQWPVYTGGRARALERAAVAEREASGRDLQNARADLRLETTRAFWALVTATESVRVVEQSVRRVEAQLSDVRAQYDAGFRPPNDVLTVESQVSRQRTLLIQARNQRDAARAELARLIGAPVDAAFEPAAALDSGTVPESSADPAPSGTVPDSTPPGPNQGQSPTRADREALALRLRAAGERIDAAQAGNRPTLAVVAGYDYARPNPKIFPRENVWQPAWDVGVNVSWTFWNGGRTAAEVAEARHQAAATRARLDELDSRIALEIRQRRLDLESARAQVPTASDAVRSAAEAQRVVRERFDAGVATSTDLLDAQMDLLQAELDRTRALADIRLAEARLRRALGGL